ncbi:MAG: ATPase, partial [Betaproteobacteria bacterium]|nr:ATPase [Betaproteobacteria bacterium]
TTVCSISAPGAEIEQTVVAAIYEALSEKKPLSTEHIAGEIGRTRPLSVVMAEKVEALRAWAAGRTVSAD